MKTRLAIVKQLRFNRSDKILRNCVRSCFNQHSDDIGSGPDCGEYPYSFFSTRQMLKYLKSYEKELAKRVTLDESLLDEPDIDQSHRVTLEKDLLSAKQKQEKVRAAWPKLIKRIQDYQRAFPKHWVLWCPWHRDDWKD